MGYTLTAFDLRMQRAQELVRQGAVRQLGDGLFAVRSQGRRGELAVRVKLSQSPCVLLDECSCTCEDWARMAEAMLEHPLNPGISQIDSLPACKHLLAALLYANVLGAAHEAAALSAMRSQVEEAHARDRALRPFGQRQDQDARPPS
jgi:hypothetical protein